MSEQTIPALNPETRNEGITILYSALPQEENPVCVTYLNRIPALDQLLVACATAVETEEAGRGIAPRPLAIIGIITSDPRIRVEVCEEFANFGQLSDFKPTYPDLSSWAREAPAVAQAVNTSLDTDEGAE